MKICVVTPRFTIAGVPLAQVRFAEALVRAGHEVTLIVGFVESDHVLPDVLGVTVRLWSQTKVRGMLWPLVRYLRDQSPDVVFSAEDHLNTVVLLAALISGSKAKISGSSRVTPFDTYSDQRFSKRWILKQITRAVMWRADVLSCVSKDMVEQYQQVFTSPPHVDIYNIVDDKRSRQRMSEPLDHSWATDKQVPLLVAAGRLAPWKGFTDLIRATKLVSQRRAVRLLILGDGPMRAELSAMISDLGLIDIVQMPGYVENPLKYFCHADVFVLSSLVEGMPNVLVEAMMCNCTPVSTNCPTGPRELLQDGAYGYLVPIGDPVAMANAIERALDNPIPSTVLAEAVKPFKDTTVVQRHFDLLGLSS